MDENPSLKVEQHSNDHEEAPVNKRFVLTLVSFQLLAFLYFATFAEYADSTLNTGTGSVSTYYPLYQDVHVMIFIGFGFLMTFLRKHGFNSLGMTFLIGVMSIMLGTMWNNVIHGIITGHEPKLTMTIPTLITGDFAAGAVLISYGVML